MKMKENMVRCWFALFGCESGDVSNNVTCGIEAQVSESQSFEQGFWGFWITTSSQKVSECLLSIASIF